MRVRTTFFVLIFSCFLSLSAQAQALDSLKESLFGENSISSAPKEAVEKEASAESFPLIAVSLGVLVFLFATPFAFRYFGEVSKEMHAAQKSAGTSPSKTKR